MSRALVRLFYLEIHLALAENIFKMVYKKIDLIVKYKQKSFNTVLNKK